MHAEENEIAALKVQNVDLRQQVTLPIRDDRRIVSRVIVAID